MKPTDGRPWAWRTDSTLVSIAGNDLAAGDRGQRRQHADHVHIGVDGVYGAVAESEVQIAGLPLIFPGGLAPDVAVNVPQDVENQVLAQSDSGPLDPFITDEERPRLNEAALVNGTNPELDAFEEQEAGKTTKAQLRDECLQHAIDFLITLSLYKK